MLNSTHLNLKIEISGHSNSDIEDALALILEQITQGYTNGQDRNSTGNYTYEKTGESIAYYRLQRGTKVLKKEYERYADAQEALQYGDIIVAFDEDNSEVNFK